jgi:ribonuclease Z
VLGNSYVSLGQLRLEIHELHGLRALAQRRPPVEVSHQLRGEVDGADLWPDSDGVWHIPPPQAGLTKWGVECPPVPVSVKAVEIQHTVPTVGWIVEELSRPGKLDAERIHPILLRHGIPFDVLSDFKMGNPIVLPDGTTLSPADYCEPATARKLVILSDTSNPSLCVPHVKGADILVHEATNACLRTNRLAGRTHREVEV